MVHFSSKAKTQISTWLSKPLIVAVSVAFTFPSHAVTVLQVGDSITQGGGTTRLSYREEFEERLTDAGCVLETRGSRTSGHPTPHEGYSGHTADDFLGGRGANPGIEITLATYSPPGDQVDVVLLLIGANDIIVSDSVNSTLSEIDDIINFIKTDSPMAEIYLANGVPLYVLTDDSGNGRLDTGIDTDGDGFYDVPNSDADALASGIEANYASDPDVTVVDVRTGFRPTDMVTDGIHPSPDDSTDVRSDSGEHHLAVAFAAALEADGLCVPTLTDDSFPLTYILSPQQGDSITSPVIPTGMAVDTGGSGFVPGPGTDLQRVRVAILEGNHEDFSSTCNGCTWWNFISQGFGGFDSVDAHLFQSSENYTQWRAGMAGDPGEAGLQINLPSGEYTLFSLAIDQAGNQNYFPPPFDLWRERTVFTVSAVAATCNGLTVTVDMNVGGMPTSGSDVILGTDGVDIIDAMGGADTICAGGGDDIINAGTGNDWISAGAGNDTVNGEGGNDTIFGEADDDTLSGNGGVDTIDGGDGVDHISGGPGNDIIFTGAGATVGTAFSVNGDGGNDTINGGLDADYIRGGNGIDEISGAGGNDVLEGGPGSDTIYGDGGNDDIKGQNAVDYLYGGSGADTLNGGISSDIMDGESGNDTLLGLSGHDVMAGGGGVDDLRGGPGNDELDGGSGSGDICNGFTGTDIATAACEVLISIP